MCFITHSSMFQFIVLLFHNIVIIHVADLLTKLCTYRHGRKEVFVNLLVRKIIYDYMYPVDLENNERSCEYSAIVVPTSKVG
jgi:hypothetical protein